ncbi:calcium-binding protein [Planktotalea sp.]|uniref:calcium-binding protein n=1 Tax=Planktotalea sp. TaxID=2029877 RepID=UPI003D6B6EB1
MPDHIITDITLANTGDALDVVGANAVFVSQTGQLLATSGYGIDANDDGTYMTIAGTVYGALAGINMNSAGEFYANTTHVTFTGTVSSNNGDGMNIQDSQHNLINDGLISGRVGVDYSGTTFEVVNRGVISGQFGEAMDVIAVAGHIRNFGSITSNSDPAIRFQNSGPHGENTPQVINYGTISGQGLSITSYSEVLDVLNYGLMDGGISGSLSNDEILNDGAIYGTVELGKGDDIYVGSGSVSRSVNLGEGADFYNGKGDSNVTDGIFGGIGDDTLLGGNNDDLLYGDADNDLLRGRSGDDLIEGGIGSDTIRGGDGEDTITGGDGADVLKGRIGDDDLSGGDGSDEICGGEGDDTITGGKGTDLIEGNEDADVLNGGKGDDTIRGGDGDDIIIGGLGSDLLTGGAGADVFIFESAAESTNNAARDEIDDFGAGDVIDLSSVIVDTLDFIGTGAFTGTANEVRIKEGSQGNTTVYVDTDGDGSGDMRIFVTDTTGMTASDFIL